MGSVNEGFAIESMRGDVFLLGNTPWRIRRVESGRVKVEDAQGSAPTIPFWLGEAPGRTNEFSNEVSDLRDELYARLDENTGVQWLASELGFRPMSLDRHSRSSLKGFASLELCPARSV